MLYCHNVDYITGSTYQRTFGMSYSFPFKLVAISIFLIFLAKNLDTKNDTINVPIADELLNDLKEYYNEVSKFKSFDKKFYVFGNDFGIRPLVYAQAQRRKGEIANKDGVKEIMLHDFRHSCASLLVNNKAPITVVSSFLGHSNTTETLNHIYLKVH